MYEESNSGGKKLMFTTNAFDDSNLAIVSNTIAKASAIPLQECNFQIFHTPDATKLKIVITSSLQTLNFKNHLTCEIDPLCSEIFFRN